MIEPKTSDCAWGMAVMILGLGLHFYTASEYLASLMLSSFVIFLLGLVLLSVLFAWYAGKRVAVWARAASRNVTALPRRLAAHARPRTTG